MRTEDTMQLYGVKPSGETVLLGDAPITPAMKRADIAREQFGPLTPDESGNDADMCLWALEQYHEWLVKQGCGPAARDILLRAADAIEALDGTSVENEKLVDDFRVWRAQSTPQPPAPPTVSL